MFSLLEEQNVPVVIHCADPENNWDINSVAPNVIQAGWFYGDGTFCTKQELYDEVFSIIALLYTVCYYQHMSRRQKTSARFAAGRSCHAKKPGLLDLSSPDFSIKFQFFLKFS